MTDVFISYAREDRRFVQQLHDALANAGRESWVDWEGIPASAKWMAEVRAAIDEADCFCFVVSPDSVESPVCREEAAHAAASNKRILPLLHRGVPDGLVPETVAAHNWIDFEEQAEFDQAFDTLVRALETEPEHLRTHTRLLVRAKEWETNTRNRSYLLRGQDLTQAESWLGTAQGKEPAPTQLHTAYVLASRKAASRRQRTTIGAVAIALVLSLVLSAVALIQRGEAIGQRTVAEQERREAERQRAEAERQAAASLSRQLVVVSLATIDDRLDTGILLSIEAALASETPEARGALAQASWHARLLRYTLRDTQGRTYAAISPDGDTIALSGAAGIGLWDAATGGFRSRLPYAKPTRSIAFSPDGATVAAGAYGAILRWDVETGRPLPPLAQPGWVRSVAFSPDGELIAGGGNASTIVLWDARTGQMVRDLAEHHGIILSLAFSPDGRILASSDNARSVRLWGVHSGRELQGFTASDYWVLDVSFAPDGKTLAVATFDGIVWLWDIERRRASLILNTHGGYATSVAISPDGRTVVSGTSSGSLVEWDLATGRKLNVLQGGQAFVRDVVFTPDGRFLLSSSDEGLALLWEITADYQVATGESEFLASGAVAVSPDGNTASWGHGAGITTLDLQNREVGVLSFGDDGYRFVTSLDFSLDGGSIAVGGIGGPVRLWDLEAGAWSATLPSSEGSRWLEFSPHGGKLVTGDRSGAVIVWDVPSQRPLHHFDVGRAADAVAFSPHDGILAAGIRRRAIRLFDVGSGGVIGDIESGSAGVMRIAFDPAGDVLASAHDDGLIRLWDVAALRLLAELSPGAVAGSLVFDPQGKILASGLNDGIVLLWDVATRQVVARISAGEGVVTGLAFTPDGESLITGADTRGMALWHVPDLAGSTPALANALCDKVRRDLTTAEWDQYVPGRPYHATCAETDTT